MVHFSWLLKIHTVVWFSEGLYWQNEGIFHNVLLLEGKLCRFDSIGIRLYRDGICRGKKTHCVFVKSSGTHGFFIFYPLKYHYLLFSSKIVRQTFILTEYYIYYLSFLMHIIYLLMYIIYITIVEFILNRSLWHFVELVQTRW